MPSDSSKFPPNPFAAAMGQAQRATEEFQKMLGTMKLPAPVDVETLLAVQKRNMDALSAANRIALEGAQAVAKRHMEIMQQTMAELSETMRAMATPEGPQAKAARQAEMLKSAYERAVANTKEMTDLIQQANGEAVEQLNKRFAEAVDEIKGLIAKSGG
jgi:phasin family protein